MCEPVSLAIASAVVATATQVGSVIQQSKLAKSQTKSMKEAAVAAREENRMATSAELFDRSRAGRREQGSIRAAAGEAGLALNSGSMEALLLDSAMQTELANTRSVANMESRQRSNDRELRSGLSQIQSPTLLGAGLQIGGSVLDGFSSVKAAKIPKAT